MKKTTAMYIYKNILLKNLNGKWLIANYIGNMGSRMRFSFMIEEDLFIKIRYRRGGLSQ